MITKETYKLAYMLGIKNLLDLALLDHLADVAPKWITTAEAKFYMDLKTHSYAMDAFNRLCDLGLVVERPVQNCYTNAKYEFCISRKGYKLLRTPDKVQVGTHYVTNEFTSQT